MWLSLRRKKDTLIVNRSAFIHRAHECCGNFSHLSFKELATSRFLCTVQVYAKSRMTSTMFSWTNIFSEKFYSSNVSKSWSKSLRLENNSILCPITWLTLGLASSHVSANWQDKLASTVLSGNGGILADYKLAKINIKCILVYFFINKYMLTKPWHLRSVLFEKRKWLFLHDIWITDMVILTPRYENEQIRRKPKSTRSWLTETRNCLVSIRAEGEEFQQVQNSENIEILKQRKWKNNEKANNYSIGTWLQEFPWTTFIDRTS